MHRTTIEYNHSISKLDDMLDWWYGLSHFLNSPFMIVLVFSKRLHGSDGLNEYANCNKLFKFLKINMSTCLMF